MSGSETYLIVGASLAGARAAEALRKEGFDGRVLLLGEERGLPNERPPLTKEYLRGESAPADLLVHEEGFYEESRIELLPGTRAVGLDVGRREVTLGSGDGSGSTACC